MLMILVPGNRNQMIKRQMFFFSVMGTNRQLGVRFADKADTGVPGLISDLQALFEGQ